VGQLDEVDIADEERFTGIGLPLPGGERRTVNGERVIHEALGLEFRVIRISR
jgi:hypothetical protein